jgi:hypothetical protein
MRSWAPSAKRLRAGLVGVVFDGVRLPIFGEAQNIVVAHLERLLTTDL